MKKLLCWLAMAGWTLAASAQSCPPEWVRYTLGGYLYDIQSDCNTRGLSETAFKQELLNAAHANLAKQVRIRVQEFATLDKQAVDGRSRTAYASSTQFSTDVDLQLVGSHTSYDAASGQGFAIVFIDRSAACTYYQNEIARILNRADNALATANDYVASGFKSRAAAELQAVAPEFDRSEEPFFWLNFFGLPQAEQSDWMARCNDRQQAVKRMIAELQHGTCICLRCTADLFGRPYPMLQHALKGSLAKTGCSFTDNAAEADWIIEIEVSAREGSTAEFGGMTSYFAYADATVAIDKRITGQRVCEDGITVKGGHTRDYTEAARAACKDLYGKLETIITNMLKQ